MPAFVPSLLQSSSPYIPSSAPRAILRVCLADKLHNARALLRDVESGTIRWKAFNAGPQQQIWYYRRALKIYRKGPLKDRPMVAELKEVVEALDLEISTRQHAER